MAAEPDWHSIPQPNLPGEVRNFFHNPKERLSSDAYNVRIDHRIERKGLRIRAHFAKLRGKSAADRTAGAREPAGLYADLDARSWMFSETHTVSPNKVNEFRFGFIYTHRESGHRSAPRLFDEYGIKGALDEPKIKGLPQFNINAHERTGHAEHRQLAPSPATGSGNFPSEKSGKI